MMIRCLSQPLHESGSRNASSALTLLELRLPSGRKGWLYCCRPAVLVNVCAKLTEAVHAADKNT